ncbi:molecular chaperone DnaK [Virgisporangium aliadipatigenens]|uniref:Molecular chaperone DnaK n=1 Tax=Virgisporangium aliadipatigenens TaxID=741659 RepID=A0A8J4DTK7_9ACTN|nr:Hsp70 family protein [Virgisporangium aliadipatigenens]GIJ48327.1 molecular chaperone DnaK [Virgisporangium aliadipatigenens]
MSDTGQSDAYFGIDLGTTYSVVAYMDEYGRPAVVRNAASGKDTTPSVVYFEGPGNVVVGTQAKNVAMMYPDRVVERVKRSMGRELSWEFDGQSHTPESISALILKQLAQDASAETGREVRDVVITVPAYFGMLERDATRNAGRIAGLNVIGIVPEPVAAALQYDVTDDGKDRTVLVYDLGGGTFDTTVIRIAAKSIEVLCTDGDQELGGVDWDDRLTEYVLEEFISKAAPDDDPREDRQFIQDLRRQVEELKQNLSAANSRSFPIRFGAAVGMVEVTRETFERITRDLLESTLRYTDRTLDKLAAKLGVTDPARHIDDVLLVGGSSRMPAVRAALTEKYGWDPKLHDPDLAVAKGAAKFALSRAVWEWDGTRDNTSTPPTEEERREAVAALAQRTGVDADALARLAEKEITNVLPKAFGVRLVDTDDPTWQSDPERYSYIEHLVHADEKLPSGIRPLEAGTVVDGQTEVEIALFEQAGGEESRDLDANKQVDGGTSSITGLPHLPRNSAINIAMQVDSEGLLTVTAREPVSGRDLTINVRVSVMSEREVAEAQSAVSAIAVRA